MPLLSILPICSIAAATRGYPPFCFSGSTEGYGALFGLDSCGYCAHSLCLRDYWLARVTHQDCLKNSLALHGRHVLRLRCSAYTRMRKTRDQAKNTHCWFFYFHLIDSTCDFSRRFRKRKGTQVMDSWLRMFFSCS